MNTTNKITLKAATVGINILAMNITESTQELSYYKRNKEKFQASYQRRKMKCKQSAKLSYERRKAYYNERMRHYYNINKDEIRKKGAEWQRKNRARYKIEYNLRLRMRMALLEREMVKSVRTEELLGCTVKEAKAYLESLFQPGMSWDNYGLHGWHIDHIKPINTFDLSDLGQQKQCFHYTNLRPLWAKDNLSRPKDGSDL